MPQPRHNWLNSGFLAISIALFALPYARAYDAPMTIKSEIMLRLVQHTDWSALPKSQTNTPLTFVVLGNPALADTLRNTLAGRTIAGRKLELQTFQSPEDWISAREYGHVLIISPTAQAAWPQIRAHIGNRPILTLGESPDFCTQGGMLNLYFSQTAKNYHFDANPEAAQAAGLTLGSEMLRHAQKIVKTDDTKP